MDPLVRHLQAERRRAAGELADLEVEFASLADPDVVALDDEHDSEGATIGYERARVGGLIERTRRRLAELDVAMERSAQGRYLTCEACGGPIDRERLEALPATRLCIACARARTGG